MEIIVRVDVWLYVDPDVDVDSEVGAGSARQVG